MLWEGGQDLGDPKVRSLEPVPGGPFAPAVIGLLSALDVLRPGAVAAATPKGREPPKHLKKTFELNKKLVLGRPTQPQDKDPPFEHTSVAVVASPLMSFGLSFLICTMQGIAATVSGSRHCGEHFFEPSKSLRGCGGGDSSISQGLFLILPV